MKLGSIPYFGLIRSIWKQIGVIGKVDSEDYSFFWPEAYKMFHKFFRQLATATAGVPLFEVFVTRDGEGGYNQQVSF